MSNRRATVQPNFASVTNRVARFSQGQIYVQVGEKWVQVPFIPCKRCKGTGEILMGKGIDAGVARCGACQGKGKLSPLDIQRNAQFTRDRMSEAAIRGQETMAEFDKLVSQHAS